MAMDAKTRRELQKAAAKRNKAREAEEKAWEELTAKMKAAYGEDGSGATFAEIGDVVGVTKARVYQVVTGNRGGKRKDLTETSAEQPEQPGAERSEEPQAAAV